MFTPHDNTLDPEVERELATHTQHSENLQAFTLSELKQVIKQLNPLRPHHSSYDTGNATGRSTNSPIHIQRYNQIGILAGAPKTRKDHHDTKAGKKFH